MTTVLLVRHGATDVIGHRITGRLPGVHLNDVGRKQVHAIGEHLARRTIAAVYTSPMERALETAHAIAARAGGEPRVRPGLTEMDFGSWSGLTLEELDGMLAWKRFNVNRTGVRAPGGEHIADVQQRMVSEMEALREHHGGELVVAVSHGDPLKTVIAHYLGFSLELLSRIELAPASITELELGDFNAIIRSLNVTADGY